MASMAEAPLSSTGIRFIPALPNSCMAMAVLSGPSGMRLNLRAISSSMSFIGSEGRLDRNLTSTRDGYLGTTVGVGTTYPLNHLLHLPAYCGSYYVGGFVDGVFTGSRYAEPTGTSRTAVLFGGDIGMQY